MLTTNQKSNWVQNQRRQNRLAIPKPNPFVHNEFLERDIKINEGKVDGGKAGQLGRGPNR